ncbi:MAG: hypothetical protein ACK4RS_03310 [Thiothrix sp.]
MTTMGEKQEKTLPNNYVGTVKVHVRGKDYYVHSTAPMAVMSVDELKRALKHNRTILKRCQEEMRKAFEKEAFEYAAPAAINYDTPVQDAIQAHLNISMIIPLINLKGGYPEPDPDPDVAPSFTKPETLNVQERIMMMRNIAEKSAFMDRINNHQNAFHSAALITLALLVFLSITVF